MKELIPFLPTIIFLCGLLIQIGMIRQFLKTQEETNKVLFDKLAVHENDLRRSDVRLSVVESKLQKSPA